MKKQPEVKRSFKEKAKKTWKVIFQKKIETEDSLKSERRNKIVVYGILAVVALVLTILNITNKKDLIMTISTAVLILICLVCVLVVWKTKNRVIPDILLSISIAFIFSYYAVAGQNEGFAILWIVLVPAVGMLLLSFKAGLITSTYFLLFLIIIFYTPIRDMLPAVTKEGGSVYTQTFMVRFPLLYLADFLTAIVLSAQKLYYLNKAQNISLYDQMTGLKNRRYFMDLFEKSEKDDTEILLDTTIVVFDLNNLKLINDKFGHFKGDEAIRKIASILTTHFGKHTDYIYRIGGDEFVVVFNDKNNRVEDVLNDLNDDVNSQEYKGYSLSVSFGYVKKRDYLKENFKALLSIAEKNMYKCKENYYKKSGVKRYRGSYEDFD